MLDQGHNGSSNSQVTAAEFLCTMSLTGGDRPLPPAPRLAGDWLGEFGGGVSLVVERWVACR